MKASDKLKEMAQVCTSQMNDQGTRPSKAVHFQNMATQYRCAAGIAEAIENAGEQIAAMIEAGLPR